MAMLPRIVAALVACSAAAGLAQTSWPAAQRLAEATLARHPEAVHVVLHVTPPGAPDSDNLVIGSTMGRLGKKERRFLERRLHEVESLAFRK